MTKLRSYLLQRTNMSFSSCKALIIKQCVAKRSSGEEALLTRVIINTIVYDLQNTVFHYPIRRYIWVAVLLLTVSTHAFGQKGAPLASQAKSVLEYEAMVRNGLLLSHEDSILIAFGQMKGMFRSLPVISSHYGKCGTELAAEAIRIQDRFSKQLKDAVILGGASLSDSIISSSGRFTIHFSKAGPDSTTTEYADSVAYYADEAYKLEIDTLGYAKPPFTSADSTWHIYLYDQGSSGIYGYTSQTTVNPFASSPSGLPLYRAYITMDNDFPAGAYKTVSLNAARITVFHEFHHVIQFGSYGDDAADGNFREMTSVWLEMRSSPWIPDYLQYIDRYLSHIDQSFDAVEGNGYPQCIWMQYLEKKFGEDIIKNIWQFYSDKQPDFLLAIDSILVAHGTDFCTEYKRFGTAVYYTGRNFQGASLFPDARKFNPNAIKKIQLLPNTESTLTTLPASLHIFTCGYGKDTSVITISRSTDRAWNSNDTVISKSVLTFEAKYQFPETFCDTISLPTLVGTKIFPQPYIITSAERNNLNILASTKSYPPSSVVLNIYSLTNRLIRHIERAYVPKSTLAADPFGGSWYVEWDGKDDNGMAVPSGIYYYSLLVDTERDNGKFVVIRKN